jgi:hypothetical protein
MERTMSRKKPRKLDFESLLLECVPVTIGEKHYTLREASTEIFAKYRSAIFSRSTMKTGKSSKTPEFKIDGLPDLDIYLLSLCLTEDATGHNVTEAEIRVWPNRITEPMIDELKEMSGIQMVADDDSTPEEIQEEYQEQVKNLPSDATAG